MPVRDFVAHRSSAESGFSLIELMIAIAIGLLLLLALTTFVVGNLQANRQAVNAVKLNQELRSAMDVIARELRRANFSPTIQTQFSGNSAVVLDNTIVLGSCGADRCAQLEYGYSGGSRAVDLSGGAVRLRLPPPPLNPPWEALTDPGVVAVTALDFCFLNRQTGVCGSSLPPSNVISVDGIEMSIQIIQVSITGQLVADPTIVKTINQAIRVRNDALGIST